MVLQALLAIDAAPARPAGADRHPVTDGNADHTVGNLLDDAGNLVAQHHRLLDADGAEAAMLEIVQVRAADAALAYPDPDLAGLRTRLGGDGFDPQVFGGVDDKCFHESSYKVAVTPPSTYRMWPLTNFEASLARNTAGPTRSSTSPQRRDGVRPISQLLNSGFFTSASLSSVLK